MDEITIPDSKEIVQSLIYLTESGIYVVYEGKFIYVSHLFETLSGYSAKELIGTKTLDLVHPDDRDTVRQKAILMLKGELQAPYEYRFLNKDGSYSWILGKLISIHYDGKKAAIGSFLDITEHKQIQIRIAEQQNFLRQVIDSNPNLIFVKDEEDCYILANKALAIAYGTSPENLERKTDFHLGAQQDEVEKYRKDDLVVLQSGEKIVIPEESFTWPSGEVHYYQTIKVPLAGADGKFNRLLGVSTDITARKMLEQKLTDMATHDTLTGLPNRALFYDHYKITTSFADRVNRKIAIVLIDLDGFKSVNDTYGHDVGDKLLVEVANRLQNRLRKSDIIARLGGDEFVLQLSGAVDREAITTTLERIIKDFQIPFEIAGHTIISTFSMGVSVYPDNGKEIDTLIKIADTMMYKAKSAGKNMFLTAEISFRLQDAM
jgi:diguanylate cyclase (GGDEF)-like protein/PAS domain S-box-containing protein